AGMLFGGEMVAKCQCATCSVSWRDMGHAVDCLFFRVLCFGLTVSHGNRIPMDASIVWGLVRLVVMVRDSLARPASAADASRVGWRLELFNIPVSLHWGGNLEQI